MSFETEALKKLNSIDDSLDLLAQCFIHEMSGETIHSTLENMKVINHDISKQLKRIADALEKQVFNQIEVNKHILKNLTTDDAGQQI